MPFLLSANLREHYLNLFGDKFNAQEIQQCKDILGDWKRSLPEDYGIIEGLRAKILVAEGKLNESNIKMEKALSIMEGRLISSKTADIIRNYYDKAWNFDAKEEAFSTSRNREIKVELCKSKQPNGVKLRYWLGVAHIVAGCIAAPFSGGTSLALISTGLTLAGNASADALDNKEAWQDDLNHRQRTGPENTSCIPQKRMNLYPGIISV